MMLRRLLVLPVLMNLLVAQGGENVRKPKPGSLDVRPHAESGEASDTGAPIDGDDAGRQKVAAPEGPAVRRGAATFCQFHVHAKPAKLMPGQTGTLIVTAVLKGEAVLPSPAPIEVLSSPRQGVVTLGAYTARPADPGRLARAYLGRPVYDNYAILEMPISVGPEAVVGTRHTVAVELQFDLFDGNSAQSIGTFVDRAVGSIEIGQAPDPAVQGGYTPPVTVPTSTTPTGVDAPTEDTAAAAPPREAIGGTSLPGADVPVPAAEPPADTGPVAGGEDLGPAFGDEEPLPWALIAGGGALVILLLLLVLKRR